MPRQYINARSVIETTRRRTIGAFEAIRLVLNGQTILRPEPIPQPSG